MPSHRIIAPSRVRIAWAVVLAVLPLACDNGEDIVAPQSGQITVITVTVGTDQDPTGYTISLDDGPEVAIGVNASLTISAVAGEHTIELRGIAEPCSVGGSARRTVAVVPDQTVQVTFQVSCAAPAGGLTITTATSGGLLDPDGYTIRVDEGSARPIGLNESLTVENLAPGLHTVLLEGLAANCAVQGDNPREVEILADATATVELTITCLGGVQSWTPMPSGTTADLTDAWGTSGSDVFVVGERDTDQGVESVILRFDGNAWAPQYTEDDLRLRGLWGSSTDNVYAVGFGFLESRASLLHWDGARWSPVGLGLQGPEELGLLSIWGSSPSDIFAVGFAFDQEFEFTLIYHFDGVRWERVTLTGAVLPSLVDVWGSSATDVYAVGQDDFADVSTGVIIRYDGASWREVLRVEGLVPNGIWGSSPSDVFAAGFQVEEIGDDFMVNGAIWHFDGAEWSRMALPEVGILQEIWGSSPNDVYAVGDDGLVLHYDGSSWTPLTATRNNLLGIWGGPPGDVFAVGNAGTILRGTR